MNGVDMAVGAKDMRPSGQGGKRGGRTGQDRTGQAYLYIAYPGIDVGLRSTQRYVPRRRYGIMVYFTRQSYLEDLLTPNTALLTLPELCPKIGTASYTDSIMAAWVGTAHGHEASMPRFDS